MERKDITLELGEEGQVAARVATFGVKDADGDVTRPGFFGDQQVAIAWAHDWGTLVGKGRLTEDTDGAVFAGGFFTETVAGREAHATVKAMGDLMQWSYGFDIVAGGASQGLHDDEPVRFLQPTDDGGPGAKVFEVSPVLVGAGVGTGTIGVKRGERFADQLDRARADLEAAIGRADEIKTMRAEQGSALGADTLEALAALEPRLKELQQAVASLLSDDGTNDDALRLWLGAARAIHDSRRLTWPTIYAGA